MNNSVQLDQTRAQLRRRRYFANRKNRLEIAKERNPRASHSSIHIEPPAPKPKKVKEQIAQSVAISQQIIDAHENNHPPAVETIKDNPRAGKAKLAARIVKSGNSKPSAKKGVRATKPKKAAQTKSKIKTLGAKAKSKTSVSKAKAKPIKAKKVAKK